MLDVKVLFVLLLHRYNVLVINSYQISRRGTILEPPRSMTTFLKESEACYTDALCRISTTETDNFSLTKYLVFGFVY
jgi:hypothetical protein